MTQASKMKTPPAPWNDIPWQQWENWHWELANRLTTVEQIGKVIHLTDAEKTGIANSLNQLRMAITPYYASLMDPNDPRCPIRIRAVPTTIETEICQDDLLYPLHEAVDSPAPTLCRRQTPCKPRWRQRSVCPLDPLQPAIPTPRSVFPANRIGNRSLWGDKIQSLGDSITEGYYRYALFKNLVKANYDFDYVGSGYEDCMV